MAKVVPSQKDLFKKYFKLEYKNLEGDWCVVDTFSHYEYDLAIDIGINKFIKSQTLHRLVDQDEEIVILFDNRMLDQDEVLESIKSDRRWTPGKRLFRQKLINVLTVLIAISLIFIFLYTVI